ncbi:MAG: hypothetical protein Q4A66_07220, partial [Eubacteriales bacterium]|nr:hypothetical protein [Eubacteriales bacterium]
EELEQLENALLARGASGKVTVLSDSEIAVTVVDDETGAPLSSAGAKVTMVSLSASGTTKTITREPESSGTCFFTKSELSLSVGGRAKVSLRVEAPGYRTVIYGYHTLEGGESHKIRMIKDDGTPYIMGASINGGDMMRIANGMYLSPRNDMQHTVTIFADTKGQNCTFSILQGERVVASKAAALSPKDVLDIRGAFMRLGADGAFVPDVPISLKIQSGETNETTLTPFSVVKAVMDEPLFKDSIPVYMGNMGMSIDTGLGKYLGTAWINLKSPFTLQPTAYISTSGSWMLGIGYNRSFSKMQDGWKEVTWLDDLEAKKDASKELQNLQQNAENGLPNNGKDAKRTWKASTSVSANVTGFVFAMGTCATSPAAPGVPVTHDVCNVDFGMGVTGTLTGGFQITGTILYVPCFVNGSVSGSLTMSVSGGFTKEDYSFWDDPNGMDLSTITMSRTTGFGVSAAIDVSASAGIGVPKMLSLGIRGGAGVSGGVSYLGDRYDTGIQGTANINGYARIYAFANALWLEAKVSLISAPPWSQTAIWPSQTPDMHSYLLADSYEQLQAALYRPDPGSYTTLEDYAGRESSGEEKILFRQEGYNVNARAVRSVVTENLPAEVSLLLEDIPTSDSSMRFVSYRDENNFEGTLALYLQKNKHSTLVVSYSPSATSLGLRPVYTHGSNLLQGWYAYEFDAQTYYVDGQLYLALVFALTNADLAVADDDTLRENAHVVLTTRKIDDNHRIYPNFAEHEWQTKVFAPVEEGSKVYLPRVCAADGDTGLSASWVVTRSDGSGGEIYSLRQATARQTESDNYDVLLPDASRLNEDLIRSLNVENVFPDQSYAMRLHADSDAVTSPVLFKQRDGSLDSELFFFHKDAANGKGYVRVQEPSFLSISEMHTHSPYLTPQDAGLLLIGAPESAGDSPNMHTMTWEKNLARIDDHEMFVSVTGDSFDVSNVNGDIYAHWVVTENSENAEESVYQLYASLIDPQDHTASQPILLMDLEHVPGTLARFSIMPLMSSRDLYQCYFLTTNIEQIDEKRICDIGSVQMGLQTGLEICAFSPDYPVITHDESFISTIRVQNTGDMPITKFAFDIDLTSGGKEAPLKHVSIDLLNENNNAITNRWHGAGNIESKGRAAAYRIEDNTQTALSSFARTVSCSYDSSGTRRSTGKTTEREIKALMPGEYACFKISMIAPSDLAGGTALLNASVSRLTCTTSADSPVSYSMQIDGDRVQLQHPQPDGLAAPSPMVFYTGMDRTGARTDALALSTEGNDLEINAYVVMQGETPVAQISIDNTTNRLSEDVQPVLIASVNGKTTYTRPFLTYLEEGFTRTVEIPLSVLCGGQPYEEIELRLVNTHGQDYGEVNEFTNSCVIRPVWSFYIAEHPASASVYAGDDVRLSVWASGPDGRFSYQWQMLYPDGTVQEIAGANSPSLLLENVSPADSGRAFRCMVWDSSNAMRASEYAFLSVSEAPVLPQTGHPDQSGLYLALMALSAAAAAVLVLHARSRRA